MTVRAVSGSREQVREHVVPMMDMVEEELARLDESGRGAVLQFLTGTADRMEDYLAGLRERPADTGGATRGAHRAREERS